ncbi:Carbohydrate Esterase Family 4 protein [Tuber magnatum]|uniref:Carbohydrate Esterase Family 4 protein n=1 Tax=Tuber magnatum TaxID=42249 RepID=A0A317SNC8_9PEZI|nr:Carbohydrate Esterase Family 4 protein [Tuber magnatum]
MRGVGTILALCAAILPEVSSRSLCGRAACTKNLIIDNYATYSSHLNSLGSWTSDDGSMTSLAASTANKKLTFTPKTDGSSYFYTTFENCISATTDKYNAITFPFKGPAGGFFTLELQTASSCSASYTSYYYDVTGLTGSTQTITVPLSSFPGANLGVIKAWAWSGFSAAGTWELGQTSFVCPGGSTSVPVSSATSTTSTATTSTSSTTSSTGSTGSTSTTSSTSSTSSASTSSGTGTSTTSSIVPTGTCQPLLIDDWASQSRLTFLFYNAMNQPTSDDGTMTSIVVANNHVTLTPKANSYFYSNFGCVSAANKYGGISLRIKADAGTTFTVQMQSSSTCSASAFNGFDRTTTQLGWTFDGTEKLYSIPFSSFSGLDTSKLTSILFISFNNKPVTFGPMAFYCGSTPTEYIPPPSSTGGDPSSTVPVTSATASAFVIDQFSSPDSNALGFWHGGDDPSQYSISGGKLTVNFRDTDYSFYTQVTATCRDMSTYEGSYLHIAYSGSNLFTIALQQHNSGCNEAVAPYPETWDVVEARRYSSASDIYVPISHFNIVKSRVIGVALKAFLTSSSTVVTRIEIVNTVPSSFTGSISAKLPTAPLHFVCKRPNSFAFAIDDGVPELAQQVLQIVKEENIKVTFFTVGAPLLDSGTNLSNVYSEMLARGHQVALHSFTHPKMESLPTTADIDWELQQDIAAVQQTLHISSKYFRPPFGNEGARLRQRLEAIIPGSQVINWSVDVEDWLWATSSTPEKQLDAFRRDVNKGGNLVVMHYLYPSTVNYLKQFIQIAKATGKQLMRVDQCMMDPNAPPL